MTNPSGRVMRWWWLGLVAAPALWLAPMVAAPTAFPYLVGASYTDLAITHWPNTWFLRHSLLNIGQIPLWNPNILSGMPFAADPLSGLWYPPSWLALPFPSVAGLNLLFGLHLVLAGVGMAALCRRLGLGIAPAVIAGLAYGGLPKLVGHIGLGHLGLVEAASWTPWLLLALETGVRTQSRRSGLRALRPGRVRVGVVFPGRSAMGSSQRLARWRLGGLSIVHPPAPGEGSIPDGPASRGRGGDPTERRPVAADAGTCAAFDSAAA